MDFLGVLLVLLGLVIILGLAYYLITGTPIPKSIKVILLIAAVLMFILCLGNHFGCPALPVPVQ